MKGVSYRKAVTSFVHLVLEAHILIQARQARRKRPQCVVSPSVDLVMHLTILTLIPFSTNTHSSCLIVGDRIRALISKGTKLPDVRSGDGSSKVVRGRHLSGEPISLRSASFRRAYILRVLTPDINLQLVKQSAEGERHSAETILVESGDKCIYSVKTFYFYSSLLHIGFPSRARLPAM